MPEEARKIVNFDINKNSPSKPRNVIPLSPVERFEELNDTTKGDFRIYEKYLDEAFDNSRIRNIAVSGNFGVGKSSVLRVYENSKNRYWLHVSMGNFRENSKHTEDQKPSRTKTQKELEIDLLRQITAKCKPEDIPRTSFKLVPSQEKRRDRILKVLIPLVLALIVGLIFAVSSSVITEVIHNALYIALAVITSLGLGFVAYCIYPKLNLSQLSLKTNHAEVSADYVQPESYLEQHCFELVYVLESLVRKNLSNTIVFEDMDRLDVDMSIEIFSKLREINALVNSRLEGTGKKLVFIYVVNDKLMSCMKMEKFFDYILSVVPIKCNRRDCNCEKSLRLKEILEKEFTNTSDVAVQKMLEVIGPNFNDFRMIYTVLNDYRIFTEIGRHHGNFNIDDGVLDPSLFVFLIYKNLRPSDYYEICRIGTTPPDWLKDLPQDQAFLKNLSENGFLTENCLQYIGC